MCMITKSAITPFGTRITYCDTIFCSMYGSIIKITPKNSIYSKSW